MTSHDREREPRPEDLQYASYWDRRYQIDQEDAATAVSPSSEGDANTAPPHGQKAQLPDYDWFRSFSAIRPFLSTHLPPPSPSSAPPGPSILHLGCGNSTLPADLHALAYHSQVAVDFSRVCIDAMADKYAHLSPPVSWQYADVRDMRAQFGDGSFDVAVDKGTLDAMLHGSVWDPPDDVRDSVGRYVREVKRVLRQGGLWLYVTYRQPHFVRGLLEGLGEGEEGWEGGARFEVLNQGGGEFEYFGWVMRKGGK